MTLLPKISGSERHVSVKWSDSAWTPRIVIGPAATQSGFWFSRSPKVVNERERSVKESLVLRRNSRGFTLIELLIVIGILGVLAGLLLPLLSKGMAKTKIKSAQIEIRSLQMAIISYDTAYSRPPAVSLSGKDMTFGILNGVNSVATNSDLMIVLLDFNTGINFNHARNPANTSFFSPAQSSDPNSPGFSTIDNQLRDPWGNPYVITLDFDGDGYCQDAVYGNKAVANPAAVGTQGLVGLSDYFNSGVYELHAPVMIWSRGPDGKADATMGANAGVNRDNVLGWQ